MARGCCENPGFAAIAGLSLALGFGANTAIFQLLDAVRLRTLPVKNPQELGVVRIDERKWTSGRMEGPYSWLTRRMWEQIRDHQEAAAAAIASFLPAHRASRLDPMAALREE